MPMKKTNVEKLLDNKDLPRIVEVDDPKAIKIYGGTKMLIAPPMYYYEIMKKIPEGQLITSDRIRGYLAKINEADYTCPLTAGIFINIVAGAAMEDQEYYIPYYRTLKKEGQLNEKFPGGIEYQKALLELEGHKIIKKGNKYYVADYQFKLYDLDNKSESILVIDQ